MNSGGLKIRHIEPRDNTELAKIIRSVLDELHVPREGTTYADKELDAMYECFNRERAVYWVVEEEGQLLGGGGIIQLRDAGPDTCELQKMYLLESARGRGIGSRLLQICLESAKELGYRKCYLETMSDMMHAQQLYINAGFTYLERRLGDTGHYVCPVWMIRELQ